MAYIAGVEDCQQYLSLFDKSRKTTAEINSDKNKKLLPKYKKVG